MSYFLAIGGDNDSTVTYDDLAAWKIQTIKEYSIKLFPGGHFFLTSSKKEVWNVISLTIKNILEAGAN